MGTRIDSSTDNRNNETKDPEDIPFRRRFLLILSIVIVTISLIIMEWWAGVGVECDTHLVCDCYPRGIRCWIDRL